MLSVIEVFFKIHWKIASKERFTTNKEQRSALLVTIFQ